MDFFRCYIMTVASVCLANKGAMTTHQRSSFVLKLRRNRNAWAAGRSGFRWGSLQHSPRPIARLRGPTSKGEERGRKERGREGEGNANVHSHPIGRDGIMRLPCPSVSACVSTCVQAEGFSPQTSARLCRLRLTFYVFSVLA